MSGRGIADNVERMLAVLEHVYEASVAPSQWDRALRSLADAVGAGPTLLHAYDPQKRKLSLPCHVRCDPDIMSQYEHRYVHINPYLRKNPRVRLGDVGFGEAVVPTAELVQTEFYKAVLEPQDMLYTMGGCVFELDGVGLRMSANRSGAAGPFGEEEAGVWRALLPHVRRAIACNRQMGELALASRAGLEALDHLRLAVLALDSTGRVMFANARADDLLKTQDGLTVSGGRLTVLDKTAHDALQAAIGQTLALGDGSLYPPPAPLCVPRPSGKRSLGVVVSWASSKTAGFFERQVCALVFIADPSNPSDPSPQQIAALLGLTPREAELAKAMAQGYSLKEAAEQLQVSIHTVRAFLRQIFAKTGVHRQAELVRLVHAVCPVTTIGQSI